LIDTTTICVGDGHSGEIAAVGTWLVMYISCNLVVGWLWGPTVEDMFLLTECVDDDGLALFMAGWILAAWEMEAEESLKIQGERPLCKPPSRPVG
jgi:hypothetical protein